MKQVDVHAATAWLESRLGDSRLETALLGRLAGLSRACVVGLSDADAGDLNDASCRLATTDGDAALAAWFAERSACGPQTVMVLDDLARRGDPVLAGEDVAYNGSRVLSYAQVDPAGVDAAAAVRRGGSGYPTIAVVVPGSPDDLGLVAHGECDDDRVEALASHAAGVIVSVHDAETWLVLTADADAVPGRL